jgi:hypothetical protein
MGYRRGDCHVAGASPCGDPFHDRIHGAAYIPARGSIRGLTRGELGRAAKEQHHQRRPVGGLSNQNCAAMDSGKFKESIPPSQWAQGEPALPAKMTSWDTTLEGSPN